MERELEKRSTVSRSTYKRTQKDVALVALLKAYAEQKELYKGCKLHADILKKGLLTKNIFIANTLVNSYVKFGALGKAQIVFDELLVRDLVSWTALIMGYAQHGDGGQAIELYERMQQEGISPNAMTFSCILKACSSKQAVNIGKGVHADIVRKGLLGKDTVLGNALVDMFSKCGALAKAEQVFNDLPVRNTISWNALSTGYCQHGYYEEAILSYERMQGEGLFPDEVTFLCILNACGSIGAAEKGKEIHQEIARWGFLEKHTVLGNALVDMYAKCGALANAQQVFDNLLVQSVVPWTALMAGYTDYGHSEEALQCYEHMIEEGFCPNAVTFLCILKACSSLRDAEKGEEIHNDIAKSGWLGKDTVLGSALVSMYAKCGALTKAREVFDQLPLRDVVSWTILIVEYCQQEQFDEALECFEWMKREGHPPDPVIFACLLKACGSIGAGEKGKQIHSEIAREGYLGKAPAISTALVDMYSKCGAHAKAQEVFKSIVVRDVVSWTAIIGGYAQLGQHKIIVDSFSQMVEEGIEPNVVTFTVVLSACSSLGFIHEGLMYFESMNTKYGIIPTPEHWTCMVDLFCREGHLHKAMAEAKKMPHSVCLPAWFALLSACGKWGNARLGQVVFQNASQSDKIFPFLMC